MTQVTPNQSPRACIDYVLVHELKYHDHGATFETDRRPRW